MPGTFRIMTMAMMVGGMLIMVINEKILILNDHNMDGDDKAIITSNEDKAVNSSKSI